MIKSFADLEVYKRSQSLYPEVVKFTRSFPSEARHLKDQMCRAANSIHANIAEGYGRSPAEFKMYLTRSLGSCNEILTHITDAVNARFGDLLIGTQLLDKYTIIGKQVYRLKEKWF